MLLEGIAKEKCRLTKWDDEKKELVSLYGEIPEEFPDCVEEHKEETKKKTKMKTRIVTFSNNFQNIKVSSKQDGECEQ
jgi:hypothetical protein